jgi:hypothetical protein
MNPFSELGLVLLYDVHFFIWKRILVGEGVVFDEIRDLFEVAEICWIVSVLLELQKNVEEMVVE